MGLKENPKLNAILQRKEHNSFSLVGKMEKFWSQLKLYMLYFYPLLVSKQQKKLLHSSHFDTKLIRPCEQAIKLINVLIRKLS